MTLPRYLQRYPPKLYEARLLTTPEVAAILSVHPKTLARYRRQGLIKAIKLGSEYRYTGADVIVALQKMEEKKNAVE